MLESDLRLILIALSAYLKINYPGNHLKKLEKQ